MVIFSCDATPFGTSLKHKMNCQSLGVEIMLRWNILSNFSAPCELPVLIGTPKRPHLQKATVSIFGMISTGHIPSICQPGMLDIKTTPQSDSIRTKLYPQNWRSPTSPSPFSNLNSQLLGTGSLPETNSWNSHLKMDGWLEEEKVSFWGPADLQWRLLLVLGRVIL